MAKTRKKTQLVDGSFKPATAKSRTSTKTSRKAPKHAKTTHKSTKRSATLKRPTPKNRRSHPSVAIDKSGRTMAGQADEGMSAKAAQFKLSRSISRFHDHTPISHGEDSRDVDEDKPVMSPMLARFHEKVIPAKTDLVKEGLSKADAYKPAAKHSKKKTTTKAKKNSKKRRSTKTKRKPSAKLVSRAAVVASLLLLSGYVAYLNVPNIALRVAASRAGFDAKMPSYQPNGYSYSGPINYTRGEVIINFSSEQDDRQYQVVERKSNWDSQSLLNNYVKQQDREYLTYYDRGLTVYILEDEAAAWVNGGIWYTVEGDSALNSEQLLKIAASL